MKKVFKAADAPIEWDEQYNSKTADPRTNSFITRENLDSVLVRPLLLLTTSRTRQVLGLCVEFVRASAVIACCGCHAQHCMEREGTGLYMLFCGQLRLRGRPAQCAWHVITHHAC